MLGSIRLPTHLKSCHLAVAPTVQACECVICMPVLFRWLFVVFMTVPVVGQDLAGSVGGRHELDGDAVGYRFFSPNQEVASDDDPLPLVVFLHGIGSVGTDNRRHLTHAGGLVEATRLGASSAYLLAPQAPRSWTERGGRSTEVVHDLVLSLIERHPIDPARIYITGLSNGAIGMFPLLVKRPYFYAAAAPLSGAAADTSMLSKLRDLPLWFIHGGADSTVPVSMSKNAFNVIKATGGRPLFTELPGKGHAIWDPIYRSVTEPEFYEWMFSHIAVTPMLENDVLPVGAPAGTDLGAFLLPTNDYLVELEPPFLFDPEYFSYVNDYFTVSGGRLVLEKTLPENLFLVGGEARVRLRVSDREGRLCRRDLSLRIGNPLPRIFVGPLETGVVTKTTMELSYTVDIETGPVSVQWESSRDLENWVGFEPLEESVVYATDKVEKRRVRVPRDGRVSFVRIRILPKMEKT